MHRLEDMRTIKFSDVRCAALGYVCEVDEDGRATNVVYAQIFQAEMPESARPRISTSLEYWCECGQEFGSWEEAKDHIDFELRL